MNYSGRPSPEHAPSSLFIYFLTHSRNLFIGNPTTVYMKKIFMILMTMLCSYRALAQNTLKLKLTNNANKQALIGATVTIPTLKIAATTDTSGMVILNNIPNGKFEVEISFVGFDKQDKVITFPVQQPEQILEIDLDPDEDELAEVTVTTTRTNQNQHDIPTRVEALPLEELDEKSSLSPGNIKLLLGEATGINVQQTSAVSGTASFRIEGLDSRYTQLLQDGMPMYQGYSGGLSLLQISPLDLKQVEYIQGSASTLYGGGAIAGLINLISKTPEKTPELTLMLDETTAKGTDASIYYAQKWRHIGTTIFSSYNSNGAYAPGNTVFTAIPQTHQFTINPKVFFYADDRNSGWIGVNANYEHLYGGDMQVIEGHADSARQYFERNNTFRFSTQLSFTHKIDSARQINIKNTAGYFNRELDEPGFSFSGNQLSSYTEVNYVQNGKKASWVAGINLITDHFTAQPPQRYLSYNLTTVGTFVQNTYKVAQWFSIESGLRVDENTPAPADNVNGLFILPRINALFNLGKHFTSRLGGGLGYKTPSIFNDQSEQDSYQNIQALNIGNTKAEQSYGLNADLNYKGSIGDDAAININQLFFYTRVNHPLILEDNAFVNAPGYLNSQGAETNIKLILDEVGFYVGYTYTNARLHYNGQNSNQPLTPKNRLNFDGTYEIEHHFRFGVESFYTGPQMLSDGTTGRGFITFGLLVQKMWKHIDIFINAENLTDQRQTRWGSIYTGNIVNPSFMDIYAPLEGLVVNAGVRVKILN